MGNPDSTKPSNSENMASSVALKTAKKELRLVMKQKLSSISSVSVAEQSDAVFMVIKSLKTYQAAKRVGIYLSMPSGEIQTDAIVRHALLSGKKVFVPYIHKSPSLSTTMPKSVMDMVDLHSMADYDSLERDSWGIPTIATRTVEEREHILNNPANEGGTLDLIIMPGVAFDVHPDSGLVRRLGHGKGFYDYFLYRYKQTKVSVAGSPSTIPEPVVPLYGLALTEQFLSAENENHVPAGEYDSLLQGLVVGNGSFLEAVSNR